MGSVKAQFGQDYVSPGLTSLPVDFSHFPWGPAWSLLEPASPSSQRFHRCNPKIGLTTWDENTLLYNYVLRVADCELLEIGCWIGWSTLALGLAGPRLTVIDPVLAGAGRRDLPQGRRTRRMPPSRFSWVATKRVRPAATPFRERG